MAEICARPSPEATFLAPIDGVIPASRHLALDGSEIVIDDGGQAHSLRVECEDAAFADLDGDGTAEALLALLEHRDGDRLASALLVTADRSYYLGAAEQITDLSAAEGELTYTMHNEGYADTVRLGLRKGRPVRVDQHGGLPFCLTTSTEVDAALAGYPLKETPEVFPGEGPEIRTDEDGEEEEIQQIPAYDEQPVFALPGEADGYVRAMFLLDGGDIHRWTDYRCGWIRADRVKHRGED